LVLVQPKEEPEGTHTTGHSFQQAITITLLNPYAVLFFMAFFPVFIRSAENNLIVIYAVMTLALMMISAAYLSFLICASYKLALVFQQNQRVQLIARRLCGCVFIVFGLKVAMLSR
jgi:threonine/homoserine/homoserine lactone efflux protein